MDLTSRRSRAVSISAVSFHQLDDAVKERWLKESVLAHICRAMKRIEGAKSRNS